MAPVLVVLLLVRGVVGPLVAVVVVSVITVNEAGPRAVVPSVPLVGPVELVPLVGVTVTVTVSVGIASLAAASISTVGGGAAVVVIVVRCGVGPASVTLGTAALDVTAPVTAEPIVAGPAFNDPERAERTASPEDAAFGATGRGPAVGDAAEGVPAPATPGTAPTSEEGSVVRQDPAAT